MRKVLILSILIVLFCCNLTASENCCLFSYKENKASPIWIDASWGTNGLIWESGVQIPTYAIIPIFWPLIYFAFPPRLNVRVGTDMLNPDYSPFIEFDKTTSFQNFSAVPHTDSLSWMFADEISISGGAVRNWKMMKYGGYLQYTRLWFNESTAEIGDISTDGQKELNGFGLGILGQMRLHGIDVLRVRAEPFIEADISGIYFLKNSALKQAFNGVLDVMAFMSLRFGIGFEVNE